MKLPEFQLDPIILFSTLEKVAHWFLFYNVNLTVSILSMKYQQDCTNRIVYKGRHAVSIGVELQ